MTLKMKWIQQLLNDSLPKLVQLKYADAPAWPGRLLLHALKHRVSSYQQHMPIPLGLHSFAFAFCFLTKNKTKKKIDCQPSLFPAR